MAYQLIPQTIQIGIQHEAGTMTSCKLFLPARFTISLTFSAALTEALALCLICSAEWALMFLAKALCCKPASAISIFSVYKYGASKGEGNTYTLQVHDTNALSKCTYNCALSVHLLNLQWFFYPLGDCVRHKLERCSIDSKQPNSARKDTPLSLPLSANR